MRSDRGDTLIEVLMAVVIIGIGAAAVLTALGEGATLSGVHRQLSKTDTDARNFSEALSKAIDTKAVAYTPCAPLSAYSASAVGFSPSPGGAITITQIAYWNGSAFSNSGCTATTDTGVQRVTVTVTNADTRGRRTVDVVIRKPCTLADVTAGPCV